MCIRYRKLNDQGMLEPSLSKLRSSALSNERIIKTTRACKRVTRYYSTHGRVRSILRHTLLVPYRNYQRTREIRGSFSLFFFFIHSRDRAPRSIEIQMKDLGNVVLWGERIRCALIVAPSKMMDCVIVITHVSAGMSKPHRWTVINDVCIQLSGYDYV